MKMEVTFGKFVHKVMFVYEMIQIFFNVFEVNLYLNTQIS